MDILPGSGPLGSGPTGPGSGFSVMPGQMMAGGHLLLFLITKSTL